MIEFKTDGTPVDIDSSYREIQATRRVGKRFLTNGKVAFDILAPGSRRTRLLANWQQEQERLLKAKPVVAVEHLRETVIEEPIAETANIAAPVIQIDEQAEADEFIQAISDWEIDPNGFYDATFIFGDSVEGYALAALSNDEHVFVVQGMLRDTGQHLFCLPKGQPMLMRIKRDPDGRLRAVEVDIVDPSPCEEFEVMTITHWRSRADGVGGAGSGKRECGCEIFIRNSDDTRFAPGDVVQCLISYSHKLHKTIAVNPTLVGAGEN